MPSQQHNCEFFLIKESTFPALRLNEATERNEYSSAPFTPFVVIMVAKEIMLGRIRIVNFMGEVEAQNLLSSFSFNCHSHIFTYSFMIVGYGVPQSEKHLITGVPLFSLSWFQWHLLSVSKQPALHCVCSLGGH